MRLRLLLIDGTWHCSVVIRGWLHTVYHQSRDLAYGEAVREAHKNFGRSFRL